MVFCQCYGTENLERIKKSGGWVLWSLTIFQAVFFVLYSLSYTFMWNLENDNCVTCPPTGTSTHFLSAADWYRWIAVFVLELGSIFFLFKSIGVKEKNPNELFAYMTLVSLLNLLFMLKLVYDCVDIQNNYIDWQKLNPGWANDTTIENKAMFFAQMTFWSAIFGLAQSVIVLVLNYMVILPLRDGIYEEIFWQVGGNANVLEQHKARTQFVAGLEMDFFVMVEFGLTFGFYCYDMQEN
jgi:hypothetical protein